MSSKVDSLPFPIGETLYHGNTALLTADISAGTLKGDEFLGRIYEIEDKDYASSAVVKPYRSHMRRWIMPVRNMSGSTLQPKRLFAKRISTTNNPGQVAGYSFALYEPRAYPADEFISTTLGIPNRDVFYIVVQGPAMCTNGAAADGTEIIGDGDYMVAKAGTSATNADAGRVVEIDPTATDLPASAHINFIGFAMGARLTTEVTQDILVNVIYHG
jgi:hypothetical protein